MTKIVIALLLLGLGIAFWIRKNRSRSILDIPGRNKHLAYLAQRLGFAVGGDEYFIQLEGKWKELDALIYPHAFEGPGSITIFYFDTGIPIVERNWIEPSLSLGRAIVEWKRKIPFHHEISGSFLPSKDLLPEMERWMPLYPYI